MKEILVIELKVKLGFFPFREPRLQHFSFFWEIKV